MKNVLLVIAPGHEAPKATERALQRATEVGGGLVVLAVLDPDEHARVATALSDVGFVGERVSEDVVDALEKERRVFAEMQVQQVAEEARRRGIECTAVVEEGDPNRVCARVAAAHGVVAVVLVCEKRSWMTRFLSRSAPVKLPVLAGFDVEVMED